MGSMTFRTLRLGIVFPLAMVVAALVAPVARAEDILRIEGPVTDTTGVLDGSIADIEAAITATLDEHGVQVFVLFVSTTEDRTAEDYAFETAAQNSLGGDDALVVVALDDRTDYIWLSDGLDAISDSELDEIITGTLEPGLRDGDFAGAVIATVQALGVAAAGDPETVPPILPGPVTAPPTEPPDGPGGPDGGIGLGTILAFLAIGGGGFLVWRQWRMRKLRQSGTTPAGGAAGGAPTAPPVDAKALARQANALLIATDERIRDAAQETDFAEAQYGPDAVTTFRAAVAESRERARRGLHHPPAVGRQHAGGRADPDRHAPGDRPAHHDGPGAPGRRDRADPRASGPRARCARDARRTAGPDRGCRRPPRGE